MAVWYFYLAILAIVWIYGIPWIIITRTRKQERDPAKAEQQHLGLNEEGSYLQWLHQRQDERTAIEKERVRIGDLSPKAFAQFVADLPSVRRSALQPDWFSLKEANARLSDLAQYWRLRP